MPLVLNTASTSADLAQALGLRMVDDWSENADQVYVFYDADRLVVGLSPVNREHPVAVDFELALRNRHPGRELLIKAVGAAATVPVWLTRLQAWDATAF